MNDLIYVYLTGLSDPVQSLARYKEMAPYFRQKGIVLEYSEDITRELSAQQKADLFNKALRSQRYDWIVDISGGDLANLTLPYLDYEAYANSKTYFAGFSDLTCVVNALAQIAHKKAVLFAIGYQTDFSRIEQMIKTGSLELTVQGLQDVYWPDHARIVGGNLRCFLKLAGTGKMPDASGRFVFLESMSGTKFRIASMLGHLAQLPEMDQAAGFVFGRFNQLEREFESRDDMYAWLECVLVSAGFEECTWFKAENAGHIENTDAIWISATPAAKKEEKEC